MEDKLAHVALDPPIDALERVDAGTSHDGMKSTALGRARMPSRLHARIYTSCLRITWEGQRNVRRQFISFSSSGLRSSAAWEWIVAETPVRTYDSLEPALRRPIHVRDDPLPSVRLRNEITVENGVEDKLAHVALTLPR